ncbi:MAG: hypothetical protein AB1500_02030 [Bacillota bacterium]
MPPVFWTGKLSPATKIMADFSNALAWITGGARDTAAMKRRIKMGYDGVVTDDVARYDAVGREHFTEIARVLLERTQLDGKTVLDVGCGTGKWSGCSNRGALSPLRHTGLSLSAKLLR